MERISMNLAPALSIPQSRPAARPQQLKPTAPAVTFEGCPACWAAMALGVAKIVGATVAGAGALVGLKRLFKKADPKPEAQPQSPEKPAGCCHAKKVEKTAE